MTQINIYFEQKSIAFNSNALKNGIDSLYIKINISNQQSFFQMDQRQPFRGATLQKKIQSNNKENISIFNPKEKAKVENLRLSNKSEKLLNIKLEALQKVLGNSKRFKILNHKIQKQIRQKLKAIYKNFGIPNRDLIIMDRQANYVETENSVNQFFENLNSGNLILPDQQCIYCCEKFQEKMSIFFKNYQAVPHLGISYSQFHDEQILLNYSCAILNALGGYLIVGVNFYEKSVIEGFTLDQEGFSRMQKQIKVMKTRLFPQFQLQQKLIQLQNKNKSTKKYILLLKYTTLHKNRVSLISTYKKTYSMQIQVRILSDYPQKLTYKELEQENLYEMMNQKYKNRSYIVEHQHINQTSSSISQIQSECLPNKQNQIPISRTYHKSKQFMNLIILGSSKKKEIINDLIRQLINQKRAIEIHQPFKNDIFFDGKNGRDVWVMEHDEKLVVIKQLLKKYDRGGNIKFMASSRQITFFSGDLKHQQNEGYNFYEKMLQLYPNEKKFQEDFPQILQTKNQYVTLFFQNIQASVFAIAYLESINVKATFVKIQKKNTKKYS